MRFRFHSKVYPDAQDLTNKSENIGFLTSTMMSLIYAVIPAAIGIFTDIEILLMVGAAMVFALPIVLAIVRKNLFRKLDAEYAARKQAAAAPAAQKQQDSQVVQPAKTPVSVNNRKECKVILQRKPAECGAACLAMIMDYLDMPITLDQACAAANVTDEGCKANELMRAGKAYGLDVHGYRNEAENLRDYNIPVMIHWCGNHFVVLDEIQGDTVYINDPAVGRIKTNFTVLQEKYSNVVLTFNRT